MKRTKKAPTDNKSKRGPKSKCTPDVVRKTVSLCKLGLTDWQLARYFGVSEDTINYWKKTRPDFHDAVVSGRIDADRRVSDALYKRAVGWHEPSVKFFKDTVTEREYDDNGNVIYEKSYGRIIEHPYQKYYPPETRAAIKWLNTRQRETWGDVHKVEHNHRHLHAGHIEHHHLLEQITDMSTYTDEELELAAKIGLTAEIQKQSNED